MAWKFSNELRGRPLREIIHAGISLQLDCDTCGHRAVWPWPQMMREEKLQPLMNKMLHEFADKLKCVSCGQRNFYARPYVPNSVKPTRH